MYRRGSGAAQLAWVAALLLGFALSTEAMAQAENRWALVGHPHPVSVLDVLGDDGAPDARLWSLGDDGLVVCWQRDTMTPLSWRRFDGARALGGLYDGEVAVETAEGVVRIHPDTLQQRGPESFYPGASLPSPAGLLPAHGQRVANASPRMPLGATFSGGELLVFERSAWCTVRVDTTIHVRCDAAPGRNILGSVGGSVLSCEDVAGELRWRVLRASSGVEIASAPAALCPEAAIQASDAVVAAAASTLVTFAGFDLVVESMPGALAGTPPLGWTEDRLVFVERFDGSCATMRRSLLRTRSTREDAIWRGVCDGDETMLPMRSESGALAGAVIVQPGSLYVALTAFDPGGNVVWRDEVATMPSPWASFVVDADGFSVDDPADFLAERIILDRQGAIRIERVGPNTLQIRRAGIELFGLTLLGDSAVIETAQAVGTSDAIAHRVALGTPTGGSVLARDAGNVPRAISAAFALLRSVENP